MSQDMSLVYVLFRYPPSEYDSNDDEKGNADNGSIVVVLLDDNEVTLKRLRQKGQSIALEPANSKHETRIFGPNRVKIQGQLKAILRRY